MERSQSWMAAIAGLLIISALVLMFTGAPSIFAVMPDRQREWWDFAVQLQLNMSMILLTATMGPPLKTIAAPALLATTAVLIVCASNYARALGFGTGPEWVIPAAYLGFVLGWGMAMWRFTVDAHRRAKAADGGDAIA